jgi:hypothetical protein
MHLATLQPRCKLHAARTPAPQHARHASVATQHCRLPHANRGPIHVSCSFNNESPDVSESSGDRVTLHRFGNVSTRAALLGVGLAAAGAALPATSTHGGAGGGSGWFGYGWGGGSGGSHWFGVGAARADEESDEEEDEDEDEEGSGSSDAEEEVASTTAVASAPDSKTAAATPAPASSQSESTSSSSSSSAAEDAPAEAAAAAAAAEKEANVQINKTRRTGHDICTEVVFENYPNITEGFAYPTQVCSRLTPIRTAGHPSFQALLHTPHCQHSWFLNTQPQ